MESSSKGTLKRAHDIVKGSGDHLMAEMETKIITEHCTCPHGLPLLMRK